MIVASSFGLELKDALQQDIPPFRDSYQTAQYLACLSALGAVSPEVAQNDITSAFRDWTRRADRH